MEGVCGGFAGGAFAVFPDWDDDVVGFGAGVGVGAGGGLGTVGPIRLGGRLLLGSLGRFFKITSGVAYVALVE